MNKWVVLYMVIGLAAALACDRKMRSRHWVARLGAGLLCLGLWPLWAPVVLLPGMQETAGPVTHPLVQRIQLTLGEAQAAIAGTPLASLLPTEFVTRLLASVGRVELRHAELQKLLAQRELRHESQPANAARSQMLQRLVELRQQDERTLHELCALTEALHLQLLLARYSGASADSARELALELGTQVESLAEWLTLGAAETQPRSAEVHQAYGA